MSSGGAIICTAIPLAHASRWQSAPQKHQKPMVLSMWNSS
jgi:hypothetical protein